MVSATSVAAVLLAAALAGCAAQPKPRAIATVSADNRPMSATVIGLLNPLLSRGAEALAAGHTDEGVRLTLEGLKLPGPVRDIAAAHANLCAGYVLLRRLAEALAECNTSIALDATNWRAYNNRAAVFAAQGQYERALQDIAAGLRLAPGSPLLQRSLSIIHRNEQLQRRRGFASVA